MANVLNPENVPLSKVPEGWRLLTDEDRIDEKRCRLWNQTTETFPGPANCYGANPHFTYIIQKETPDPVYVLELSKTESIYHKAIQDVYFLVEGCADGAPDASDHDKLANQILGLIKHLV